MEDVKQGLLAVEIGLLGVGVYLLVAGRLRWSPWHVLDRSAARVAGLLLISPWPLTQITRLLFGLASWEPTRYFAANDLSFLYGEILLVAFTIFATGVVVSYGSHEPGRDGAILPLPTEMNMPEPAEDDDDEPAFTLEDAPSSSVTLASSQSELDTIVETGRPRPDLVNEPVGDEEGEAVPPAADPVVDAEVPPSADEEAEATPPVAEKVDEEEKSTGPAHDEGVPAATDEQGDLSEHLVPEQQLARNEPKGEAAPGVPLANAGRPPVERIQQEPRAQPRTGWLLPAAEAPRVEWEIGVPPEKPRPVVIDQSPSRVMLALSVALIAVGSAVLISVLLTR